MTGGRLRRALRRLTRRGVILMYHRVARVPLDPWRLCVTPERFDDQMAWLARHRRVVPLGALVADCTVRRPGRDRVAITFDDGYADNLEAAAPVLRRHGLPATVFLVADAIGAGREFWWDELERLLLRPAALPARLAIEVDGAVRSWTPGAAAAAWNPATAPAVPPWEADPTTRLGFFHVVWQALRGLDEARRGPALAALRAQLGDPGGVRPNHRVLSGDEARALAAAPGVEIGAHSLHHESLAGLAPAAQEAQIAGARARLEALLGRPVTAFAYPYGDHAPATPGLVERAGFASACTTAPGLVWPGASRFALPRLAVADVDGPTLGRQLEALLR